MRIALPGREHRLSRLARGFLDGDFTENLAEHLGRDCARAQYRGLSDKRDDGAFDSYGTGAAVDDSRDALGELCGNVLGGCRAHVLEEVRTRGGQRESGFLDDGLRHRMAREAYRDGRQPARTEVGNAVLLGQDDGHRSRPVGFGKLVGFVGDVLGDVCELGDVCDVHDQRVERRAFLGREDFRERFGLEGVAGEAVDGLCGDGDDFAFPEQPGGFTDACPRGKFHYGTKIKKRDRNFYPFIMAL